MSERVLVIGAGMGGLCTALSLAPTGRSIMLVDRDLAPPGEDPEEVFASWHRRGAGHVRQSHAFLARLRNIIRMHHPGLLEALRAAGVRELTFDAMLTDLQRAAYRPEPGDADLTILTSRRTTLELVMRRYVETLANVTLRPGMLVRRLVCHKAADGPVVVSGVEAEDVAAGGCVTLDADIVVDTGGKNGFLIEQLKAAGAAISEASETAGILYFTRHYRLKPGMSEPPRAGSPPGNGDLGYLKFGVFPGDNGCFSITLAVPEIELELRKAIVNPDTFHAITQELPGLRRWTDAARSEPRGKVYGMGNLQSRWRDMLPDGRPAVQGYFALGDTLVRTNPLYGRGCSFAAVSAEMLREALDASSDATERQRFYHAAIERELRPYYLNQLAQDRSAMRRARRALMPGHRPSLRARILRSFVEDGVTIALRRDVTLLRAAMRGFHMLEPPDKWLGRPANLLKVLYHWSRGKRRNAAAYPPRPGPDRTAMMQVLGLDQAADLVTTDEPMRRAA